MSSSLAIFPSVFVEIDEEWHVVPKSDVREPVTLARKSSPVGVLQFSAAFYRSGPVPSPSPPVLLEMVEEMGVMHNLGPPFNKITHQDGAIIAGASFKKKNALVRVWYISNNADVIMCTYVCDWNLRDVELAECEAIIRTIVFG